jgi:hypothetical protein
MGIVSDKRSQADGMRDLVDITLSTVAGRLMREGSTGTWRFTAGVKASREASQTHQTVNRGGSDHDQREEGGRDRGGRHTSLPLPVCIPTPLKYVLSKQRDGNAGSKKEKANLCETQVRS